MNWLVPPPRLILNYINKLLMWSLLAVLVSEFRCCFTLCLFIILLVQFGLLSGNLLGNSCPLG